MMREQFETTKLHKGKGKGLFFIGCDHDKPPAPTQNLLLAALPHSDYERLLPYLTGVPLMAGSTLHGAGNKENYLYFLVEGRVSRIHVLADGAQAEFAVTGREGVIGLPAILGGESMPSYAIIGESGYAYRIESSRLKTMLEENGAVVQLLLRYTQALMTQIAQNCVCNRHHTIEQQLCRWLLNSLDRTDTNDLGVTHEAIAALMGVRRESVTESMSYLKKRGVIQPSRGHVVVLDRQRLEASVCECYSVVKREYDRLLPEQFLKLS
jgi:CRP-like cAMP-binding protein